MAGLKATSCAHDNSNTKQKDILRLKIQLFWKYNFQNKSEIIFPDDLLHIAEKTSSSSGRSCNTVFLSRSFRWSLKQKTQTRLQDNTFSCYFTAVFQTQISFKTLSNVYFGTLTTYKTSCLFLPYVLTAV